jgi:hypothetical protein
MQTAHAIDAAAHAMTQQHMEAALAIDAAAHASSTRY